ncbi:MAG: aminopeptidase P family protein [Armatimonadetes bacterium]|nr:aminopeptidase P family protein [Armatimonadota bacterium]
MNKFLDFTVEEYRQRYRHIQTEMRQRGVDGLLLSDPMNLVYSTGYRTILFASKFRPFLAMIPQQGDPTLILPNLEVGDGRKTSWVEDVRGWGKGLYADAPDVFTLIRQVAEEKRLLTGTLGMEMAVGQRLALTFDQYEEIRKIFAGARIVNCSDLMWAVRIRKSPTEIEYLRKAGAQTDAGYLAVLHAAKEGMSEREMQRIVGTAMMEHGADAPGFLVVAAGPDRYDMLNPYASDYRVRKGDMVNFDIGAIYRGYWGDMTRGFFIGQPTARQRAFYEAEMEIFLRTRDAVKPGIAIEDIDKVAEATIEKLGYKEYMLHRTGHALGLDVHEIPSVALGDATVLEPGMVFTIEPGIYDFSIGAFRLEDVVVVTETGYESLNKSPIELMVR